jgi:hypothetical protein
VAAAAEAAGVVAAEGAGNDPMRREQFMGANSSKILDRGAMIFLLAASLAGIVAAQPAPPPQKGFETPQLAVDALVKAAQANDNAALLELFGPEGKDLVSSGDPVQDKNYLAAFVAKAREKQSVAVDPKKSSRAVMIVGSADWPLPIPIVKTKGKWYWDTKAGRQEILQRRIGANELDAIEECRGYVAAQKEYASTVHDSSGIHQYAQRIISSPGQRDGLVWRNADGTPGGPLGPEFAQAIEEGYSPKVKTGYHGYYFKVLTGQGRSAPLGELDYVIKGMMIGGFALIAVPVEYGVSGLKTFIVSHDGIVYEKDLGPDSLSIAKGIERYDPDKTWRRTDIAWPADSGN